MSWRCLDCGAAVQWDDEATADRIYEARWKYSHESRGHRIEQFDAKEALEEMAASIDGPQLHRRRPGEFLGGTG